MERETFWCQVVGKKYGSLVGGCCTNVAFAPYGVSL